MGGRGSNNMGRVGGRMQARSNANLQQLKEQGVEVRNTLPDGWLPVQGALTAPIGYYWASNNVSRFSQSGNRQRALVKNPTTRAQKDKMVAAISQSSAGAQAKRRAMPSGTDAKLMSLIDQGAKAYMTLPSGYSRTTNTTKPPTGWYWASSQPNGYGTKVLVKERKK